MSSLLLYSKATHFRRCAWIIAIVVNHSKKPQLFIAKMVYILENNNRSLEGVQDW